MERAREEFERKDKYAAEKMAQFEQRRIEEIAEVKRQAELKALKMSEVAT